MKVRILIGRIVVLFLLIAVMVPFPAVEAVTGQPMQSTAEGITDLVLSEQAKEAGIGGLVINGPPEPPAEYAAERAASMVTSLDRDTTLANFPSYSWVFGCSAVSAAMIAAYYDNNEYPNMYTGPTNGGVMPLSDQSAPYSGSYIWSTWNDVVGATYPNNPLVASHKYVDGMSVRGSIDDYWVQYKSSAADPYITGSWTQHTWGTAVGDFMKTSQSAYYNVDGSTRFYWYEDGRPLPCSDLEYYGQGQYDGTYGLKLFYEARGYTVTDCFSQRVDISLSDWFSLADFQAEIDSGRPVLINLDGHTVVGFGYDGSTIYIRDTWDSNPNHNYWMTWGGSYYEMTMESVSIVHIQQPSTQPSSFGKSSPTNNAAGQSLSVTLSWASADNSFVYDYCIDDSNNNECNTSWVPTDVFTSVIVGGLDAETTYYWQVRARNSIGTTYANGSETSYWSFSTSDLEFMYFPYFTRD